MAYLIAAGALLEHGDRDRYSPACIHAQVEPAVAASVRAAAIDFDAGSFESVSRLLLVIPGLSARAFRLAVSDQLAGRTCSLADLLRLLAGAAQTGEVHLFAHWLVDRGTLDDLRAAGITVVTHPVESIQAAALVCGNDPHRSQLTLS